MGSENKLVDVFLNPGEYFVGDARYKIRTVLGSCVSITLWHPVKRIGALSHFLLFSRATNPTSRRSSRLDARYGDEVMELMLHELRLHNINPKDCHGKIFGGGNMFPKQPGSTRHSVGLRNGEAARELLRVHHIPLISEHVMGVGHRQIIFEVRTGNVWLRQFGLDEAIQTET